MAAIVKYHLGTLGQYNGAGAIDWDTDTIKVALATATYTPNAATHDFFDDVTNQVTGTGYTAGGETLTVTATNSAGTTTVDAGDVTWTQNAGGFANARYAIIYKDTGVAGTSPLFGYIDLVTDKGNVAGDLTLAWNVAGIFTVA